MLKTTGSGFEGFQRDQYTTLPETDDRILATDVRAEWDYGTLDVDWTPAWERARATLLEVFATLYSRSLQQTLYAIGDAILAGEPAIDEVRLSLPNRHHLHFDLGRFGVTDRARGLPRLRGAVRTHRGDDPPLIALGRRLSVTATDTWLRQPPANARAQRRAPAGAGISLT